jgi:predicted NAD-dependent protein-ADP-ribosyltransferase YbiA (DUF1768 family)
MRSAARRQRGRWERLRSTLFVTCSFQDWRQHRKVRGLLVNNGRVVSTELRSYKLIQRPEERIVDGRY